MTAHTTTLAQVPTCTKSWVGGDGLWSDPNKWSPTGVPTATDDVCITTDGNYTVTVTGAVSVDTVTLGAIENTGVQVLWIHGVWPGTTVTATNGFTNAGTIRLESTGDPRHSNLVVTAGTLVNTGTIDVNAGTGGTRSISADVDNQGSFNVNFSVTFSKSGRTLTNNGTLAIAADQTLTMGAGSQVLNQNGGTLTIAGTYTLTDATFNLNAGTVAVEGAYTLARVTLNFNGGSIAAGAPVLVSSTLNIGVGATGGASFTMRGTGRARPLHRRSSPSRTSPCRTFPSRTAPGSQALRC